MGFSKKHLLGTLARIILICFTTNLAFAYKPEENIWKERAVQVASLPSSALAPNNFQNLSRPQLQQELIKQIPSLKTTLSESAKYLLNQKRKTQPKIVSNLPDTIFSLVNIRDVYQGKNPLSVVLLEDVHLNKEAQMHLSQTIKSFGDLPASINGQGAQPVFVGLEGAEGALLYDTYKQFSNREVATQVADSFFESGDISGPAHAGFTSYTKEGTRGLHFGGVDKDPLYQANIQAYKDSQKLKAKTLKQLSKSTTLLEKQKSQVLSPQLLQFDAQVKSYRDGKLSLAEYVNLLSNNITSVSFNIETFLQAYEMEKKFNFEVIEAERSRVLEKLVRALHEKDLEDLVQFSLAYQQGAVTFAEYYDHLREVCRLNGVTLASTPQFDEYIRYVLLTDGIKTEDLFKEVSSLEKQVYTLLSNNKEQQELVQASTQLYLISQLIDFSLTPNQWDEYRSSSPNVSIGDPVSLKTLDPRLQHSRMTALLKPFEDFYAIADKRSEAMVKNILKVKDTGSPIGTFGDDSLAVLVAGGFHTEELRSLLKKQNISYIVASPKITKVEAGSATTYLSVFDREKTTLDKIFTGQKLFVVPFVAGTPAAAARNAEMAFDVQAVSSIGREFPPKDSLIATEMGNLDEQITSISQGDGVIEEEARVLQARLTKSSSPLAPSLSQSWNTKTRRIGPWVLETSINIPKWIAAQVRTVISNTRHEATKYASLSNFVNEIKQWVGDARKAFEVENSQSNFFRRITKTQLVAAAACMVMLLIGLYLGFSIGKAPTTTILAGNQISITLFGWIVVLSSEVAKKLRARGKRKNDSNNSNVKFDSVTRVGFIPSKFNPGASLSDLGKLPLAGKYRAISKTGSYQFEPLESSSQSSDNLVEVHLFQTSSDLLEGFKNKTKPPFVYYLSVSGKNGLMVDEIFNAIIDRIAADAHVKRQDVDISQSLSWKKVQRHWYEIGRTLMNLGGMNLVPRQIFEFAMPDVSVDKQLRNKWLMMIGADNSIVKVGSNILSDFTSAFESIGVRHLRFKKFRIPPDGGFEIDFEASSKDEFFECTFQLHSFSDSRGSLRIFGLSQTKLKSVAGKLLDNLSQINRESGSISEINHYIKPVVRGLKWRGLFYAALVLAGFIIVCSAEIFSSLHSARPIFATFILNSQSFLGGGARAPAPDALRLVQWILIGLSFSATAVLTWWVSLNIKAQLALAVNRNPTYAMESETPPSSGSSSPPIVNFPRDLVLESPEQGHVDRLPPLPINWSAFASRSGARINQRVADAIVSEFLSTAGSRLRSGLIEINKNLTISSISREKNNDIHLELSINRTPVAFIMLGVDASERYLTGSMVQLTGRAPRITDLIVNFLGEINEDRSSGLKSARFPWVKGAVPFSAKFIKNQPNKERPTIEHFFRPIIEALNIKNLGVDPQVVRSMGLDQKPNPSLTKYGSTIILSYGPPGLERPEVQLDYDLEKRTALISLNLNAVRLFSSPTTIFNTLVHAGILQARMTRKEAEKFISPEGVYEWDGYYVHRIKHGSTHTDVVELGGIPVSFHAEGQEISFDPEHLPLFNPETGFPYQRGFQLTFPFYGRIAGNNYITLGGEIVPLNEFKYLRKAEGGIRLHGAALCLPWEAIKGEAGNSITMVLDTRKLPNPRMRYEFEKVLGGPATVELNYTVADGEILMALEIINRGFKRLGAYPAFHSNFDGRNAEIKLRVRGNKTWVEENGFTRPKHNLVNDDNDFREWRDLPDKPMDVTYTDLMMDGKPTMSIQNPQAGIQIDIYQDENFQSAKIWRVLEGDNKGVLGAQSLVSPSNADKLQSMFTDTNYPGNKMNPHLLIIPPGESRTIRVRIKVTRLPHQSIAVPNAGDQREANLTNQPQMSNETEKWNSSHLISQFREWYRLTTRSWGHALPILVLGLVSLVDIVLVLRGSVSGTTLVAITFAAGVKWSAGVTRWSFESGEATDNQIEQFEDLIQNRVPKQNLKGTTSLIPFNPVCQFGTFVYGLPLKKVENTFSILNQSNIPTDVSERLVLEEIYSKLTPLEFAVIDADHIWKVRMKTPSPNSNYFSLVNEEGDVVGIGRFHVHPDVRELSFGLALKSEVSCIPVRDTLTKFLTDGEILASKTPYIPPFTRVLLAMLAVERFFPSLNVSPSSGSSKNLKGPEWWTEFDERYIHVEGLPVRFTTGELLASPGRLNKLVNNQLMELFGDNSEFNKDLNKKSFFKFVDIDGQNNPVCVYLKGDRLVSVEFAFDSDRKTLSYSTRAGPGISSNDVLVLSNLIFETLFKNVLETAEFPPTGQDPISLSPLVLRILGNPTLPEPNAGPRLKSSADFPLPSEAIGESIEHKPGYIHTSKIPVSLTVGEQLMSAKEMRSHLWKRVVKFFKHKSYLSELLEDNWGIQILEVDQRGQDPVIYLKKGEARIYLKFFFDEEKEEIGFFVIGQNEFVLWEDLASLNRMLKMMLTVFGVVDIARFAGPRETIPAVRLGSRFNRENVVAFITEPKKMDRDGWTRQAVHNIPLHGGTFGHLYLHGTGSDPLTEGGYPVHSRLFEQFLTAGTFKTAAKTAVQADKLSFGFTRDRRFAMVFSKEGDPIVEVDFDVDLVEPSLAFRVRAEQDENIDQLRPLLLEFLEQAKFREPVSRDLDQQPTTPPDFISTVHAKWNWESFPVRHMEGLTPADKEEIFFERLKLHYFGRNQENLLKIDPEGNWTMNWVRSSSSEYGKHLISHYSNSDTVRSICIEVNGENGDVSISAEGEDQSQVRQFRQAFYDDLRSWHFISRDKPTALERRTVAYYPLNDESESLAYLHYFGDAFTPEEKVRRVFESAFGDDGKGFNLEIFGNTYGFEIKYTPKGELYIYSPDLEVELHYKLDPHKFQLICEAVGYKDLELVDAVEAIKDRLNSANALLPGERNRLLFLDWTIFLLKGKLNRLRGKPAVQLLKKKIHTHLRRLRKLLNNFPDTTYSMVETAITDANTAVEKESRKPKTLKQIAEEGRNPKRIRSKKHSKGFGLLTLPLESVREFFYRFFAMNLRQVAIRALDTLRGIQRVEWVAPEEIEPSLQQKMAQRIVTTLSVPSVQKWPYHLFEWNGGESKIYLKFDSLEKEKVQFSLIDAVTAESVDINAPPPVNIDFSGGGAGMFNTPPVSFPFVLAHAEFDFFESHPRWKIKIYRRRGNSGSIVADFSKTYLTQARLGPCGLNAEELNHALNWYRENNSSKPKTLQQISNAQPDKAASISGLTSGFSPWDHRNLPMTDHFRRIPLPQSPGYPISRDFYTRLLDALSIEKLVDNPELRRELGSFNQSWPLVSIKGDVILLTYGDGESSENQPGIEIVLNREARTFDSISLNSEAARLFGHKRVFNNLVEAQLLKPLPKDPLNKLIMLFAVSFTGGILRAMMLNGLAKSSGMGWIGANKVPVDPVVVTLFLIAALALAVIVYIEKLIPIWVNLTARKTSKASDNASSLPIFSARSDSEMSGSDANEFKGIKDSFTLTVSVDLDHFEGLIGDEVESSVNVTLLYRRRIDFQNAVFQRKDQHVSGPITYRMHESVADNHQLDLRDSDGKLQGFGMVLVNREQAKATIITYGRGLNVAQLFCKKLANLIETKKSNQPNPRNATLSQISQQLENPLPRFGTRRQSGGFAVLPQISIGKIRAPFTRFFASGWWQEFSLSLRQFRAEINSNHRKAIMFTLGLVTFAVLMTPMCVGVMMLTAASIPGMVVFRTNKIKDIGLTYESIPMEYRMDPHFVRLLNGKSWAGDPANQLLFAKIYIQNALMGDYDSQPQTWPIRGYNGIPELGFNPGFIPLTGSDFEAGLFSGKENPLALVPFKLNLKRSTITFSVFAKGGLRTQDLVNLFTQKLINHGLIRSDGLVTPKSEGPHAEQPSPRRSKFTTGQRFAQVGSLLGSIAIFFMFYRLNNIRGNALGNSTEVMQSSLLGVFIGLVLIGLVSWWLNSGGKKFKLDFIEATTDDDDQSGQESQEQPSQFPRLSEEHFLKSLKFEQAFSGTPAFDEIPVDGTIMDSLAVSPDGSRMAVGTRRFVDENHISVLKMFGSRTESISKVIPSSHITHALAFSPDNARISVVSGISQREFNANDLRETGNPSEFFQASMLWGLSLITNPKSKGLIGIGWDNTSPGLWIIENGLTRVAKLPIPHEHKNNFALSQNSIVAWSRWVNKVETIEIWNYKAPNSSSKPIPSPLEGTDRITCLALSPSGDKIALGTASGQVFILNTKTGEVLRKWNTDQSAIFSLCFGPREETLFTLGHKSVRAWKMIPYPKIVSAPIIEEDGDQNLLEREERRQWAEAYEIIVGGELDERIFKKFMKVSSDWGLDIAFMLFNKSSVPLDGLRLLISPNIDPGVYDKTKKYLAHILAQLGATVITFQPERDPAQLRTEVLKRMHYYSSGGNEAPFDAALIMSPDGNLLLEINVGLDRGNTVIALNEEKIEMLFEQLEGKKLHSNDKLGKGKELIAKALVILRAAAENKKRGGQGLPSLLNQISKPTEVSQSRGLDHSNQDLTMLTMAFGAFAVDKFGDFGFGAILVLVSAAIFLHQYVHSKLIRNVGNGVLLSLAFLVLSDLFPTSYIAAGLACPICLAIFYKGFPTYFGKRTLLIRGTKEQSSNLISFLRFLKTTNDENPDIHNFILGSTQFGKRVSAEKLKKKTHKKGITFLMIDIRNGIFDEELKTLSPKSNTEAESLAATLVDLGLLDPEFDVDEFATVLDPAKWAKLSSHGMDKTLIDLAGNELPGEAFDYDRIRGQIVMFLLLRIVHEVKTKIEFVIKGSTSKETKMPLMTMMETIHPLNYQNEEFEQLQQVIQDRLQKIDDEGKGATSKFPLRIHLDGAQANLFLAFTTAFSILYTWSTWKIQQKYGTPAAALLGSLGSLGVLGLYIDPALIKNVLKWFKVNRDETFDSRTKKIHPHARRETSYQAVGSHVLRNISQLLTNENGLGGKWGKVHHLDHSVNKKSPYLFKEDYLDDEKLVIGVYSEFNRNRMPRKLGRHVGNLIIGRDSISYKIYFSYEQIDGLNRHEITLITTHALQVLAHSEESAVHFGTGNKLTFSFKDPVSFPDNIHTQDHIDGLLKRYSTNNIHFKPLRSWPKSVKRYAVTGHGEQGDEFKLLLKVWPTDPITGKFQITVEKYEGHPYSGDLAFFVINFLIVQEFVNLAPEPLNGHQVKLVVNSNPTSHSSGLKPHIASKKLGSRNAFSAANLLGPIVIALGLFALVWPAFYQFWMKAGLPVPDHLFISVMLFVWGFMASPQVVWSALIIVGGAGVSFLYFKSERFRIGFNSILQIPSRVANWFRYSAEVRQNAREIVEINKNLIEAPFTEAEARALNIVEATANPESRLAGLKGTPVESSVNKELARVSAIPTQLTKLRQSTIAWILGLGVAANAVYASGTGQFEVAYRSAMEARSNQAGLLVVGKNGVEGLDDDLIRIKSIQAELKTYAATTNIENPSLVITVQEAPEEVQTQIVERLRREISNESIPTAILPITEAYRDEATGLLNLNKILKTVLSLPNGGQFTSVKAALEGGFGPSQFITGSEDKGLFVAYGRLLLAWTLVTLVNGKWFAFGPGTLQTILETSQASNDQV